MDGEEVVGEPDLDLDERLLYRAGEADWVDSPLGRLQRGWPGSTFINDRRDLRLIGWELVVVLCVFPLSSTFGAVASLIQSVESQGPVGAELTTGHVWLTVLLGVTQAAVYCFPVAVVAYLMVNSGEGFAPLNLDRRRWRSDLAFVLPVFVLVSWLPQVLGQHILGWAHLQGFGSTGAPTNSRAGLTVIDLAQSVQAGLVEEIVVLGYLVHRLEQRGMRAVAIVAIAWVLRVSYHVYYGWNVIPIAIWALVVVLVYLRIRRLWPFIIGHVAYDASLPLQAFYHRAYRVIFWIAFVLSVAATAAWSRRIEAPGPLARVTAWSRGWSRGSRRE